MEGEGYEVGALKDGTVPGCKGFRCFLDDVRARLLQLTVESKESDEPVPFWGVWNVGVVSRGASCLWCSR